jgi:hypothetical protein
MMKEEEEDGGGWRMGEEVTQNPQRDEDEMRRRDKSRTFPQYEEGENLRPHETPFFLPLIHSPSLLNEEKMMMIKSKERKRKEVGGGRQRRHQD